MCTHRLLPTLALWSLPLYSQQPAPPLLSPEEFLQRVSALPLPEPREQSNRSLAGPGSDKIDPRLQRLLNVPGTGRGDRSLTLGTGADGAIPVRIEAATAAQVGEVEAAVRSRNGEVTADFENYIWARIPIGAVAPLASLPAVTSLMAQTVDRAMQEPASGHNQRTMAPPADGVRAAHLDELHKRGITGRGVKIGILDRGFAGYSRLLGSHRVNPARAQRAFPPAYRVENQDAHGTGCAEIVSAGAPGAELYLASFDGSPGQLVEAARWLISQGVQIINYSAGNVVNPNDGTDEISRFVDTTSRQSGVLWVIAAGNHAEQHWAGDAGPSSGVILPNGQRGFVVTPQSGALNIVVRWSDREAGSRTSSSTQDIDAYLYAWDGRSALSEVAKSVDVQNGGAARPLEVIDLAGKDVAGRQFLLVLRAKHVTRRVRIHVFLDPGGAGQLYPSTRLGSILNPASARSAVAVGAVDVVTHSLAPYSSQGPTDDGRRKPEVTGPANTVSFAIGGEKGRFDGTSAASPHVAAFAALIKEMEPKLSSADLRQRVMEAVVPQDVKRTGLSAEYALIDGAAPLRRTRSTDPATDDTAGREGGAPIPVPGEFGGSVSLRTLSLLRKLADQVHDGLSVRIESSKDEYRIDDQLRLSLQANGDCTCLLFVRDADGRYELASGDRPVTVHPGEPRIVPEEGTVLTVTGPTGTDELLLVCATHPAPLDELPGAAGVSVTTHSYRIVP